MKRCTALGAWLRALSPALLLSFVLGMIWVLPRELTILESDISPDLPTGFAPAGWYGHRTQESEQERAILAADTRFSKAIYCRVNPITREIDDEPLVVSIIYSGNDMNSSIHRPERCLPAQGHINLLGSARELTLRDGRSLTFTRLTSTVIREEGERKERVRYIHYYVFVGHGHVCSSHLRRTFLDICDRVFKGKVQRWAYFQVGGSYRPDDPEGEARTDERLRQLIADLMPELLENEGPSR